MENTPSNLKTNFLGFQQDMNKFSPCLLPGGKMVLSDTMIFWKMLALETWICHPPRMHAKYGGKKAVFFFGGGGVLNLKMLKKNPGDWSWHCGWGRSKVELCLCFFFGWNEWISPSLTFKFQKLSRISRHTTSYLLEPKFFFGGWEGGLLATFGYGCHRIHGTIVY